MRLTLAAALLALLLAAPRRAGAEPELGLRLAIAPAFGSAAQDVPMSDAVPLQVPIQLDVLWRVRHLAVGGYGSWGWGRLDSCAGSCDAHVWRAGLQASWTFARIRGAEPWAGVGSGYEWAVARSGRAGNEIATTWRGWELVSAQGGVEWRVARTLALGPFVLVGAGRYTHLSAESPFESAAAPLALRALHGWVHVGVRGRVTIPMGRGGR